MKAGSAVGRQSQTLPAVPLPVKALPLPKQFFTLDSLLYTSLL
ncbi:hypothetical protein SAMN05216411_10463 [Nitrosospira multiformis]|nr:hypothetical protein SAMN05216411_10463 [Nitrosospira multiformis]